MTGGSLRRFEPTPDSRDAQPATLDFGTQTHSGLYSPGHIRIKP